VDRVMPYKWIPDYVIKQCTELLKKPLANIYNSSLESGIFPDELKIAKIVPLYKKGSTRDIQNYRPIALLSVFLFKLLEKMVHNRLMSFIEENGILTDAHHFKIKNKLKQHYRLLSKVHRRALKKMNPIGIFLDLTNAYDVLNHKVLLSTLNSYGIRGVANVWFECYLSHRKVRGNK
jgi:hypothetical protein